MTPAEELRTAATRLRSLASHPDITPGPWLCLDGGDRIIHDGPSIEFGPADYVVDEPVGNSANAELIAAMHPGVGLAVAAWLDLEADVFAAREVDFPGSVWDLDPGGDCALAVARTVNGGAR